MRLHTILVLLLAIVFCGSAAFGVILLRNSKLDTETPESQVVVALVDLARGEMVTEAMVSLRPWPANLRPTGSVNEVAIVVGRTVLAPIVSGEPVVTSRLADRDSGRGLAALIPNGQRAYTIQTSRVASNVAGFVMPGNRVDVLLTLRGGTNDKTGGGSSTTLLQAVEILAVDQRLDAPSDHRVDPQQLRSVTLLVTPDQASLLDLGQNMGTLTLSLRNLEDLAESKTEPATVNVLRFTQQEPVKAPSVKSSLIFNGIKNVMTAAAVAFPRTETSPPKKKRVAEIQTLRGRHAGRVLVRTGK